MVTRLYEQKGMDLVVQIIPELVQRNCFIAILGSGDPYIQQRLEKLRDKWIDYHYIDEFDLAPTDDDKECLREFIIRQLKSNYIFESE